MPPSEFHSRITALEQDVAAALAGENVADVERRAFGTWPSSPWQLAVAGGFAGGLLGIPWTLLQLRSLVRSQIDVFPALSLLASTPTVLLQWWAYGFVFGLCFPLVRGRTGLTKGITLGSVVVLPVLVTALARGLGSHDARRDLAVAVSQLTIHFLLLGLWADVRTLRRAGHEGMGPLLVLHNLRALVAWSTSVAVAFGTTLSAGLAGGAAAFVIGVLQPPPAPPVQQTPAAGATSTPAR